MRKTAVIAIAIVLGYVSPWLSSPDDGTILYVWFNWLPIMADQYFLLEGMTALVLDVSVLAAQYLALFVVLSPMVRPTFKLLRDFASTPRHRSGLVR